jgi:hypothetical protein
MKTNISKPDRVIRSIFGIFLIIISQINLLTDSLLNNMFLVFGIYLIVSSLINYCAIYAFLDISSNRKKERKMY